MSIRHHSKYPVLMFFVFILLLILIVLFGFKPKILNSKFNLKPIYFGINYNID